MANVNSTRMGVEKLRPLVSRNIISPYALQKAQFTLQRQEVALATAQEQFLPSLSARASATESRASWLPAGSANGTCSRSARAGRPTCGASCAAALLQSEAYHRAVQTQLLANDYYLLLAYDAQLAVARETVKNCIKDVEVTKQLRDAAIVTGAAVTQSEASRYAAEVTTPDLERNVRETKNALSMQLHRAPGPAEHGTLAVQTQPVLQTGVPGQLLRNRPDVQQAETLYRAYLEQTNAARAYFYPAFTVTANGGLTNPVLRDLFSPLLCSARWWAGSCNPSSARA